MARVAGWCLFVVAGFVYANAIDEDISALKHLSQLRLDPVVFNDTYQISQNGKDYIFYYFIDPRTSIQKAISWSIGLNWYWTPNLRFTFEYDQSSYLGE